MADINDTIDTSVIKQLKLCIFFWGLTRYRKHKCSFETLPVCRRIWTFKLPEVEKHFIQNWHLKALMPVCVFMCAVRVLLTANARKHWGHLNGFSWVWMRMWRTKSLGFLNSLEQYGQTCHLIPFSSRIEPGKKKSKHLWLTDFNCFLFLNSTVLSLSYWVISKNMKTFCRCY